MLSWIGPRGIVAASLASLFAITLSEHPLVGTEARVLETFTYSVITATVILQGLSARRPVAVGATEGGLKT